MIEHTTEHTLETFCLAFEGHKALADLPGEDNLRVAIKKAKGTLEITTTFQMPITISLAKKIIAIAQDNNAKTSQIFSHLCDNLAKINISREQYYLEFSGAILQNILNIQEIDLAVKRKIISSTYADDSFIPKKEDSCEAKLYKLDLLNNLLKDQDLIADKHAHKLLKQVHQ